MRQKFSFFLPILVFLFSPIVLAQNTRLSTHNNIGWYGATGNFRLDEKWGFIAEYQWRRDNFITDKQQNMIRISGTYQVHPRVQFRVGYAWAQTFPYGEIPINRYGKDYHEHRAFEMITITDKLSILSLLHRFTLEQRWVGRYTSADLSHEDQFPYRNRFRYMFRMACPLKGESIVDKTSYLVLFNELSVNFGKNVNENVFDQNRLGLLFGHRFNRGFSIEAGYISQILEYGREIDGRNVFQYNNGVMANAIFNFDLSKKSGK
ncbi:DUF2490 domain-containing protein [Flavobacterium pallidum]|nr:DUF2490 domain-containing protein [Flavobacterium pallidum]